MKKTNGKKNTIKVIALSIICVFLYHIQFGYSTEYGIKIILQQKPQWLFVCLIINALVVLLFLLLTGRFMVAVLISNCVITFLCIANYYEYLFHGSPFFAVDLYNLGTAWGVLSNYQLKVDSLIIRILCVFIVEMVIWFIALLFLFKKDWVRVYRKKSGVSFIIGVVTIWILLLSPFAVIKNSLLKWTWTEPVKSYGYGVCLVNCFYSIGHRYNVPDGYDASKIIVEKEGNFEKTNPEELPDIILILNETLCDLSVYTGIPEGREALDSISRIPNVISGFAVVPGKGGGTNDSEYELLTSNSKSVLSMSAPFCYLDLTNANSIVSFLEDFGYTTTAMHDALASNYSRNRAYPDLGFDKVFLGRESFQFHNAYGNRRGLDIDNYHDMITAYEEDGDAPRFVYLLTFQNHGSWEQNEASYDKILVDEDFGNFTDDVNEYLTSISMSAEAFLELTEYYSEYDRDVIILMVGDHAPNFISNLPSKQGLFGEEKEMALYTVPYYVWSNTKIDCSAFSEKMSMIDLIPALLKSVKIPLSVYYHTILDLHAEVPVRTSYGAYLDQKGNIGKIEEGSPYYEKIQNYYYMEYNNVLRGKDYREEIFETLLKHQD